MDLDLGEGMVLLKMADEFFSVGQVFSWLLCTIDNIVANAI